MAIAVAGTSSNSTSGTGSMNTAYPAGIQAGELLIVVGGGLGTTSTWNLPAGWTQLFFDGSNPSLRAAYKFADGTESGTNFTDSTTQGRRHCVHLYRFTGAHASTPPEVGSVASGGSGTQPDPPNLDPAGWDIEDTFWLAIAVAGGVQTTTTPPTGFSNQLLGDSGGLGPTAVSAELAETAGSKDPATFTLQSATVNWRANTIAIRPAAAAPAGTPVEVKSAGSFAAKTVMQKTGGAFTERTVQVKDGGAFS